MKKIEFALYVFGIMIMFPLYVFLEFNHGTKKTSDDNLPHDVINFQEGKPLQEFVKIQIQKDSQPSNNMLPVTNNTIELYLFTGLKNTFNYSAF